jgi:hypothetical protein
VPGPRRGGVHPGYAVEPEESIDLISMTDGAILLQRIPPFRLRGGRPLAIAGEPEGPGSRSAGRKEGRSWRWESSRRATSTARMKRCRASCTPRRCRLLAIPTEFEPARRRDGTRGCISRSLRGSRHLRGGGLPQGVPAPTHFRGTRRGHRQDAAVVAWAQIVSSVSPWAWRCRPDLVDFHLATRLAASLGQNRGLPERLSRSNSSNRDKRGGLAPRSSPGLRFAERPC